MPPSTLRAVLLNRVPPSHTPTSHVTPHPTPAGDSVWATIVPTWITAVATAILAAGAIFTVIYAIKAFRAQAKELVILVEQRDRDNAERRLAQAARVFTAIPRDPGTFSPSAKNVSDLPAFDAQFWYSEPGGASGPDDLGTIRPGDTAYATLSLFRDDALARTILAFRDAAGVRWIRMPDGGLKDQSCATTRDSVLVALGVELPRPGLRPPGPGSKHNLPTSFSRFRGDDQRIIVHPLGKGTLHLHRTFHPIHPHTSFYQLKVTSTDPDNQGVYTEERLAYSPDNPKRYTVTYDIWNYRDSPVTAQITRADTAEQK